jgi:peptidoglycan/LPS O-acetylase OafA/YrhL
MDKQTSVYLDFVRFSAALMVMMSHFSDIGWSGGFASWTHALGTPAVTLFFVLSGYVMAYAVDSKEKDAGTYALNRAARLYSVVLPSLVITFFLCALGHHVFPQIGGIGWGDQSLGAYARAITFTNELWSGNYTPGNNIPYWSLGYEPWYYLAFGLFSFMPGYRGKVGSIMTMVLAGPRIALMAPTWIMGVLAYNATKKWKMNDRPAFVGWLLTTLSLISIALIAIALSVHYGFHLKGSFERGTKDGLLYIIDYGVGILLSLNFMFFRWSSKMWSGICQKCGSVIRWMAGATFTLYLTHFPVGIFIVVLSPWAVNSTPHRILLYGGTLLMAFAIAQLTERKKDNWRKAILMVFQSCLSMGSLTAN